MKGFEVDQTTRPSICFQTLGRAFYKLGRAFEALRENKKPG